MNGLKNDPDVKMDNDSITPSGSGYMDDDFYEDTGELALPEKKDQKDVWVTRIPKWLFEAVSKFEVLDEGRDDDQIVIGEVLAFADPTRPGALSKKEPIRMILNNRSIAQKQLPQAFELKMSPATSDVLGNTYVFTEKDLPGYRPTGYNGRQMHYNHNAVQDPKARIQKRSKYRKAIPKQTALIGPATREYTTTALNTREYVEFAKSRTRKAIQGNEVTTNIADNLNDHTLSINVQKMFNSFIRPSTPARKQINKAARIPKNELIDLLHQCFDEYMYWPMKALKARTKQPEAYLKETLQEIAVLVKGGSFASNWKRQGLYDNRDLNAIDDLAPGGADDDDGDEDNEEMEDVL